MEIILTGDIEKALVSEAKERGTTPEELALESLRREFVHRSTRENSADVEELQRAQGAQGAQETLADFLSGFIGVLHSSEHVPGGARLSESTDDVFVKLLVEKRRQGRL
jgi:hypothetical protein